MSTVRYPHCDPRILHAPSKCQFCDMCPELQRDREAKNISFTGEPPQRGKYPCPAEQARSSASLNHWPGNRAVPEGQELPDPLAELVEALDKLNPADSE